ncbi:MAG: peptidyl-prolyl cis-trans isomerase [Erysipelotrichaceae bacterium]|nr:peptidyl-prolyl cis-trans isomerase [Erysipelotrichaceae bacterium]
MKKKLAMVTMLLSTSLIAAGCNSNEVTLKENSDGKSIIFTIKNGDKVEEYTADDLLKDLQDSSTAKSKLYSEVSRQVFTKYAMSTLDENKINTIRNNASLDIDEFKDNCSAEAKEEGTDYDKYLESKLEANGVETLEELEALYFYNGLKDEILEDFVEDGHYEYFLQKYLDTYTPFQVKHVLVAANTADTKYKDGTMSADNARKLLNIMDRFLDGASFDSVAELTDDTSSKDNGGIMPFNEAQSYVSEFRFATYAQEIFANNTSLDDRYQVAADLHVINDDESSTDYVSKDDFKESNLYSVYENGIESIKVSEILKLKGDVTSTMAGAYNYFDEHGNEKGNDIPSIAEQPYEMNVNKYDDNGELNKKYYEEYELERNQIFNRTLNSHKVQYIELDGAYANTVNSTTIKVYDRATNALVDKKVLAERENGNPIFFALASTGIHFMSMVWNTYNPQSVAILPETLNALSKTICEKYNINVSSNDYATAAKNYTEAGYDYDKELNYAYFTLYDSGDTDLSAYKYTYIGRNGAYKSKSALTKESDNLLSDISSYASYLEYYIFDAIVYQDNSELIKDVNYTVSFYDESLNDMVKEYVQDNLKSTDESYTSSVQSAAETYGSKLAREQEVKSALDNWKFNG